MSESYREQHPLLYEDLSEEEKYSPRYQRRYRPMFCKGRAKNNVKGAAAIFRLWPEHWSSSVTYWWIAIGMIGLLTIIVYNSLVVLALLPTGNFMEPRLRTTNVNSAKPILDDTRLSYNVYMHLFVDNNEEIDLHDYMPYIDIIATKYTNFKYHLIIVLNDTSPETNNFSAEENNEVALNLLWAKNSVHNSENNNVVIEHVTLSKFMNHSPLRRHWKKLPKPFIQFLTRAVSIWDKGGIAFNPAILTPRSPHAIYIEKIQNILKKYHIFSKNTAKERKTIKKQSYGAKKRVNNIRDIIDALEHDDDELNNVPLNIETDDATKTKSNDSNNKQTSIHNMHSIKNVSTDHQNLNPKLSNLINKKAKQLQNKEVLEMAESRTINKTATFQNNNDTSAVGILPMFLEFLFRNKPASLDATEKFHDKPTVVTRKRKHVPNIKNNVEKYSDHLDTKANETLRPMLVPAQTIHDFDKIIETSKEIPEVDNQFTIDIKGNIVSSNIPCHAFLGTMFSNAVHHVQESVTDFIITELSIFCKGVLSSCKGIDVILL